MKALLTTIAVCLSFLTGFAQTTGGPVVFKTSDSLLQKLYDRAGELGKANIFQLGKYRVLLEGAIYNAGVFLETQPMGGYMYGKRDSAIARNNIEIFIDYQRADGRFPGFISYENNKLIPHYGWFQGFCFAAPAYETYFLLSKDRVFIDRLYTALKKFDDYLWRTRDSDGDGCLELWCWGDNGEDNSIRFGKAPNIWPFDYPSTWENVEKHPKIDKDFVTFEIFQDSITEYLLPIESMDIMSFSYTCRDILAKISKETGNGQENYWKEKAEAVRKALKSRLWDAQNHACYDHDNTDKKIDVLIHNNLRCMHFGSFDQQMADEFVRYHLMNREEFWTPFPLPSIAVNDKMFRNETGNNWSGQPEGLTWQRTIRALENYGHYAELTMLGQTFLDNMAKYNKFTQQYDPFTGEPNNSPDGYGPTILTTMELVSRMFGVHIAEDKIYWSCLDSPEEYKYSQDYRGSQYRMESNGNMIDCYVNGQKVLTFPKGIRAITGLKGQLLGVVGIETSKKEAKINFNGKTYSFGVSPNTFYSIEGKVKKVRDVPFYKPF